MVANETPVKVFGRYAICGNIGAGGMATVHIGRLLGPVGFSRTVAIKRMHVHLAQDPEFVTMFLEEARMAARVQHSNVVATLDVVSESGELFQVMEYVEGAALSRLLVALASRGTRPALAITGAIVSQMLHGLHAVHETKDDNGQTLGLIHRDVSPDNVLIGRDGNARVLDFGIAKATEHGRRTQAGKIKGKVGYMAPEHMRGKDLDRRADLFAAAAVLWEVLTGQRLVKGNSDIEMMHSALSMQAAPPSSLVASLSPEVDQLVLRGLSPDRERRFATAREMAIAVERTLGVASPTAVAQLVESVMGSELEKKAAVVDSAVRRVAELTAQLAQSVRGTAPAAELHLDLQPAPAQPAPAREPAAPPFAAKQRVETLAFGGGNRSAPPAQRGTDVIGAPTAADPELPDFPALDLGDLQPVSGPGASAPGAARQAPADKLSLGTSPMIAAPHFDDAPLSLGGTARAPQHAFAPGQPGAVSSPASEHASQGGGPLDVDFQGGAGPAGAPNRAAPSARQPTPASDPGGRAQLAAPSYGGWQPPLHGASGAGRGAQPARSSTRSLTLILPIILLVAVLGVVALVLLLRRSGGGAAESAAVASSTPLEMASCDTMRRRVREGGNPTGLSRAGWAVELWLRGANGAAIDPKGVDMAALKGSDPASTLEVTKLSAPGRSFDEGLLVRLRGPVAEASFDEEGANRLIKAADLAFERTKAEAGSLTMGCAHLHFREVGLWFRGNDVTTASASLMFAMAGFSEARIIRVGALDGPDLKPELNLFDRMRFKLQGGRADDIDVQLARYSGTVQPMKERGGVRITFPTDRLHQALKASRVVADRAGVEDL